ncbi:MAG: hypothetical protein HC825_07215 [Oscillatoriales cyanobacterium RM1_1_9]|nr:hypothetical protein [Oscillatoriales cyanobacterium RM1_1_9]
MGFHFSPIRISSRFLPFGRGISSLEAIAGIASTLLVLTIRQLGGAANSGAQSL